MRAAVIQDFGPPAVLAAREAPAPVPREGEVLIDVECAGVTFVETQMRAGRAPNPAMLPTLPAILGNGVGGVVSETGSGVDASVLGRRVVASLGGSGGYAEHAVTSAEQLVSVPEELELGDAVALLADGRTALSLIELAAPATGETVLVEAAAGGVGTLLVQLAHDAGAHVIALAGSENKLELAYELGADVALDYRDERWVERLHDADEAVDVVLDGIGADIGLAAYDLLRQGGRFCPFGIASGSFAPVDPEEAEQRGVAVLRGQPKTIGEQVALQHTALARAASGNLQAVIGQEYPLNDAATAHAAIEARATVGKTILQTR